MRYTTLLFLSILLWSCKPSGPVEKNITTEQAKDTTTAISESAYSITPISHATAVIEYQDKTIYIDPVGGVEAFKDFDKADLVFITHTHPDH